MLSHWISFPPDRWGRWGYSEAPQSLWFLQVAASANHFQWKLWNIWVLLNHLWFFQAIAPEKWPVSFKSRSSRDLAFRWFLPARAFAKSVSGALIAQRKRKWCQIKSSFYTAPVHNVYILDHDSPVSKIALYMLQGNNRISLYIRRILAFFKGEYSIAL